MIEKEEQWRLKEKGFINQVKGTKKLIKFNEERSQKLSHEHLQLIVYIHLFIIFR